MSLSRFTFTDRARPVCQLGIGEVRVPATARWDAHDWDDPGSTWSGDVPSWVDVTCEQFTFETTYGRQASTDRFAVGTATLVARNMSGWADPHHVDVATQVSMRPGQRVRVGVDHAVHGRRWLFHGYIDAVRPSYNPDQADTVQLDLIDALGEVNRAKLAGLPDAPEEWAHYRINRLLDLAGWSWDRRHVDPTHFGVVTSPMSGQVADMLGQVADSAGGSIFGDLEARVVFRHHDWQTFHPDAPHDGVIGNVGPDDLCPATWVRPFDRADIATRVILGQGDTVVVHDDGYGQWLYGIEPFERTDLLTTTAAELDNLAVRYLQTRAAVTAPRARAVSLDARNGDAYVDFMTLVDVFRPSRYRCRLALPRGLVFDEEYLAVGVHHQLDAHHWSVELALDLAAPYEAVYGNWDGSWWDQTVWADAATLRDQAHALLAKIGAAG